MSEETVTNEFEEHLKQKNKTIQLMRIELDAAKRHENQAIADKWKARNALVIEKIKSKEKQKYLEAYQKLYVREALRNDRRTKESAVC